MLAIDPSALAQSPRSRFSNLCESFLERCEGVGDEIGTDARTGQVGKAFSASFQGIAAATLDWVAMDWAA